MNGFRWPIHSSHSDIGETVNRPKFPACWIKSWAMRLGYVMTRWGHVLQRSGSFHSHWGTPNSLELISFMENPIKMDEIPQKWMVSWKIHLEIKMI